jgi:glycosyltransferase involved in cell wall biosynthesis
VKTLVLIPTYNEIESIEKTVEQIVNLGMELDVLIIDDNSPDATGAKADQLALRHPGVRVLHRGKKAGLGAAYIAGFQQELENGYECFVEMDADGSHRADDLAKMLNHVSESELIIGSRWIAGGEVENWSKLRKLVSKLGNQFATWTLGGDVKDMTSGLRIYSRKLLKSLPLSSMQAHGYGFQIEMTYRSQLLAVEPVEVPIRFVEREGGKSKMTISIVFEAFWLCSKWGIRRLMR